jgi:hypothetical protein
MKTFFLLLVFAALGCAGYYGYLHRNEVEEFLPSTEDTIDTFENAVSPEEVLSRHAKSLLPTKQHVIGSTTLIFCPHLFLQIKYSPDGRTTIGSSMLWNLIDGELVVDTNSFDETQGFSDCLSSQAGADDFRILHLLSKRGALSKEQISQELGTDSQVVCDRIDDLHKRHLVIVANDIVRIHVESPLLKIDPSTAITRPLVQRKITKSDKLSPLFSKKDIEYLVKSAFGQDVAIRTSRFVFVPLYEVQIQNPDGSIRKTFWNAVSGKELWRNKSPSSIRAS